MAILEICSAFNFLIIVGYQNLDVANGVNKVTAPTFLKISGQRVISDLKVTGIGGVNLTQSNCNLKFYDTIGNQLGLMSDPWFNEEHCPGITKARFWKDATKVQIGYNTAKGHWYLTADNSSTIPVDNYPIGDGAGFLLLNNGVTGGVEINYNGQVDEADTPLIIANGVNKVTGNVSPTDIVAKEIILESAEGSVNLTQSNCNLKFYDTIGNQLGLMSDPWFNEEHCPGITKARFWKDATKVQIGYNTAKGHWYLTADNSSTIPVDNYPIPAGAGFLILNNGVTVGVKITLPGVDIE